MFEKKPKPQDRSRFDAPKAPPALPSPDRPKPASLISAGAYIRGDLAGEAEIQIDGHVRGDVRVGKLVLGPQGRIEGSVVALTAEIRGHVKGPVKARQVRLYGTARVEGDIAHDQLAMETGAIFEGRSVRLVKAADNAADATAA